MIFVDSSVWIDFLGSSGSEAEEHLRGLIQVPDLVSIPGPVLQEVLQGIRDDEMVRMVERRLCQFLIVHPDTGTYVAAAHLYRTLAKKGATVPPGDVTIAALAIQHACELYTLDLRHFERVRAYSTLRLHRASEAIPR